MADLICLNTTLGEVKSKLSAAVTGDRVLIPAGTVTVTSCISSQDPFSVGEDTTLMNKSITIEGGYGGGTTVLQDATNKSAAYPDRPNMIYWVTVAAGSCKFKNLTINGTSGADGNGNQVIQIHGVNQNVVFENCTFNPTRGAIYGVYGTVSGISHHNVYNTSGVQVASYVMNGGTAGDSSWASPHSMGSSTAWFYENDTFNNNRSSAMIRWATDGWYGSRVVFRHNTLNNCIFGNHGTESGGRLRGQRQFEVYNNQFNIHLTADYPDVCGPRGGTGKIFDNIVTKTGTGNLNRFAGFVNYRSDPTGMFYPFGWAGQFTATSVSRVGTTVTVTCPNRFGFSSFHGFNSTDHWVQVGGMSDPVYASNSGIFRVSAFTNTTFSFVLPSTPSSDAGTMTVRSPWDGNTDTYGYRCMDQVGAGQTVHLNGASVPTPVSLGQALEPVFVWNNTVNGVVSDAIAGGTNGSQVVVANRDFYNRAPQSGDFNFPYSPFTYPHPLNAGGDAPTVTGLTPDPAGVLTSQIVNLTVSISAPQVADTIVAVGTTNSGIASVPSTVTVVAGQTSAIIPVTGVTAGSAVVTATLNATTQDSTVTVTAGAPTVTDLTPDPGTMQTGQVLNLTVSISPVQGSNTTVNLTSSQPSVATVPSTVSVIAGQTTAAVLVTAVSAGVTVITATLNATTQDSTMTVTAAEIPPVIQVPVIYVRTLRFFSLLLAGVALGVRL